MAHALPDSAGLLAPIQPWLRDNRVSEIVCQRPNEIFVEHDGHMQKHHVNGFDGLSLRRLFRLIANENQQTLTEKTPLLSGSLHDGSRVQLVMPPVTPYPTFAIRQQVVRRLTLDDYQQAGLFNAVNSEENNEQENQLNEYYQSKQWMAFIKAAIRAKKNIVISGGTSTGKTTFLNACLQAIDNRERILTLEDTREVELPHENQVNLIATKGEQGLACVTMQDLVQCCLRLRPDRIICGEIRGQEVLDFIAACSTGHEGSFTTIHANNPSMAFMRMVQMYKLNNVPSMIDQDILRELKSVIDIIVQLKKTPQGRKISSIYYKDTGCESMDEATSYMRNFITH